jgi:hypothetical protein
MEKYQNTPIQLNYKQMYTPPFTPRETLQYVRNFQNQEYCSTEGNDHDICQLSKNFLRHMFLTGRHDAKVEYYKRKFAR